ncbi:MAG: HlyD family secretion protein [Verrucomicrobiota bacterium]|jgi:adhesin transport system membrane fusion protein
MASHSSDSADRSLLDNRAHLHAMALTGSSRFSRIFGRILAVGLPVLLLALLVLPWQQNVGGVGKVIAYDPLDRRLSVESQVSGTVKAMHVVEGQSVAKGDVICEIQDNNPGLLENLRQQRVSIEARRTASLNRMGDLETQAAQQELARRQAIDAATQRVAAEKAAWTAASVNFERSRKLESGGVISRRQYELDRRDFEAAEANLGNAQATLQRTEADFQSVIAGIRAQRASAESDLASAEREVAAMDNQIAQNERQVVVAQRDGIVLSVSANAGTFLRPGSPVCTIIPETESRFAEVWLDGNDMPLVQPGKKVRLQFEGWPAIQFVGWPSVAVGTFGGEVAWIDPNVNDSGKVRVVVKPRPDVMERGGRRVETTWPSNRWLRQGVRVNGWVLLEQVPLWKEAWRQLNGFPPVVADGEPDKFPKS